MKKFFFPCLLIGSFLTLSFSSLRAQEPCGTMERLEWKQQESPEITQSLHAADEAAKAWREDQTAQKTAAVVTIPVVVHVVYKDATQNISDAQVQSQIDALNLDFRRLNPDTANARPIFAGLGADVEIEFCLASQDPNGAPTTGITRTSSQGGILLGYFGPTDDVKTASSGGIDPWPTDQYLNVWVCDLLPILAGYAQFPGDDSLTDGVVIGYNFFGTMGTATAPYDLGRTATHEIGHWLGLRHIWGDGDCSMDDFVNDTPLAETASQGSCDSLKNTCIDSIGDKPDMIENYMDYSLESCMNMFTQGQKTRMLSFLNTDRINLLSSPGCNVLADRTSSRSEVQFSVAPNPGSGRFQLSMQGSLPGEQDIRLSNVLGKEVLRMKHNFDQGVFTLNLENQSPGVYFLQVETEAKTYTNKIIVQR